jgi:hypothetical protein
MKIVPQFFLVALAALLCLAASSEDLKLGGWQEIPLSEKESYAGGLNFLLEEANELSSGLKLTKVERQVVAGFNYRYTLETVEYGDAEAVVYKNLDE